MRRKHKCENGEALRSCGAPASAEQPARVCDLHMVTHGSGCVRRRGAGAREEEDHDMRYVDTVLRACLARLTERTRALERAQTGQEKAQRRLSGGGEEINRRGTPGKTLTLLSSSSAFPHRIQHWYKMPLTLIKWQLNRKGCRGHTRTHTHKITRERKQQEPRQRQPL